MSPLHEKLASVEWGEWRLGDLFEIQNTLSFNKEKLVDGNEYDYVTRTSQNQGILQTTGFVNQENINPAGTWSLGLLQMDFFYRQKPRYAGQFVRKIVPKFDLSKNLILYFSVILNKQKNKLLSGLVRDVDTTFKNAIVHLPTKNGEIDFAFMETFINDVEHEYISDLESDHKQELHAYLSVTGFADYVLTEEEKRVFGDFESGRVEFGEFTLGAEKGLFDVVGTKSLDSNAIDFVDEGINFIGRTFEDNGIQGKIEKQSFEPNEPMTITATVIGNYKYAKLQREPYYCSQNINKLTPNATIAQWNKQIAYYFVANIQKFVSLYDGQQGGYKLDDIKNHTIYIPILNNQPHYDMMQTLISAVQKLVIRDVVSYVERKIETIKKVIDK